MYENKICFSFNMNLFYAKTTNHHSFLKYTFSKLIHTVWQNHASVATGGMNIYILKVLVLKWGCNYLPLSSNGQLIFREESNVSLMLHWFHTTPRGSQEIEEQMRLTTVQYSCNVHWSMYRRSVPHQLLHDNYLPLSRKFLNNIQSWEMRFDMIVR